MSITDELLGQRTNYLYNVKRGLSVPGRTLAFCFSLAFVAATQAGIWPIDAEMQANIIFPVTYFPLKILSIFVCLYLLIKYKVKFFLIIAQKNILLVFILIAVTASILWTHSRYTTALSLIDPITIAIIALVWGTVIDYDRLIRSLYFVLTFILLVSVLCSAARLDFALMEGIHAGKWRGLFNHKNTFGFFSSTVFLYCLTVGHKCIKSRSINVSVMIISVIAIFGASSSTSLAISVLGLSSAIAYFIFFRDVRKNRVRFLIFSLTSLSLIYIVTQQDELIGALSDLIVYTLGRDLTFTGRAGIWEQFFRLSMQNPFGGWGYGAFGVDKSALNSVRGRLFENLRSPHNSYISFALDVGWPTVGLLIWWQATLLYRAVMVPPDNREVGAFLFSYTIAYVAFSFFESTGGFYPGLGLFAMMLCAAAITRAAIIKRLNENKGA